MTGRVLGEPTISAARAFACFLEHAAGRIAFKVIIALTLLVLALSLLAARTWATPFAAAARTWAAARGLDIGGGSVCLLRRTRIPQRFTFAKSLFFVLIASKALLRSQSTVRLMLLVAPVLGALAILRTSGESVAKHLALSLA